MELNGIKIEYTGHSGFIFTTKEGLRIAIDPYIISDNTPKVDYIFITHSHYDHCSIKDIEKIARPDTVIVVPADVQSKITKINKINMQVIELGDEIELSKFKVLVVSAYNIDKKFHTKADGWVGYLFKFDKVIIYHTGDSDNIPEMQKLSGYGKHGQEFVALLPVSGVTVMDSHEALDVAKLLNVDLAIPMHYGAGVVGTIKDAINFVELCKKEGIASQIMEKI